MFSEYRDELKNWYDYNKEESINKVKSFFSLLGYNLKDRYIIKYKDYKNNKVDWKTTNKICNDFYFKVNKFNRRSNKWYQDNIVTSGEKIIYNHLFYKHKGKNYENIQNYTSGTSLINNSDILVIDIDNHSKHNTNSLLTFNLCHLLLRDFNLPILYIEKNIFNGGYHIFLKLKDPLTQKEKQDLILEWLKENDLYGYRGIIQIPNKLRFPFSTTYNPIHIREYGEEEFVSSLFYLENIKKQYDIIRQKEEIIIEQQVKKENYSHRIYKKRKAIIYTPEKFIEKHQGYISEGNRHLPMLHIIRVGKFNGWTIDQCCEVIKRCNSGFVPSKDLSNWSDQKLYSVVEKLYSKSTIREYNPHFIIPDKFISNIQHIPENIKTIINDDIFIQQIIEKCRYKISQRNIEIFKTILNEIIGYCYFLINSKHKTINNEKDIELLKGFQFSQSYCNALKEYYNFPTIDIYKITRLICNSDILFSKVKLHNYKQYVFSLNKSNNYCIQYSVGSFNYYKHDSNVFDYNILLQYKKAISKTNNFNIINYLLCSKLLNHIDINNNDIIENNNNDYSNNVYLYPG